MLATSAQNWRQWATYYGGSDNDYVNCVTHDNAGNVYIAGWTYSADSISSPGAHQTVFGGSVDAFLVKFSTTGVRLWATYYGGADADYGYGAATDAAGNVYLTGYTFSTNAISTAGTHQTNLAGVSDAFVVKFNANGVRMWGTYYGGPDFDQGENVATDGAGNLFLTGYAISTMGIATAGSYQDTSKGQSDGFLVKFSGTNGSRIWGTYYGGTDNDVVIDIATDVTGNAIIGGYTFSTNYIASSGSFKDTIDGFQDAFVAKFNSAGNRLWSTYYGGPGTDYGFGIATDTSGSIYLAGQTQSTSGIASGGFQNSFGGFSDAYLVKFNASGNRQWATYYGGDSIEEGNDVATDDWGNVFLAGDAYSVNPAINIATPGGFQNSKIGQENFFLAAFTPAGTRTSASYYGRLHEEEARITVNSYGELFLAGIPKSTTGISYNGFHNAHGGGIWDGCLVKFSASVPRTEIIVNNPNVPPTPTTSPIKYATISLFHGNTGSMTDCALRNFSGSTPLPASGSSLVTFNCSFTGMYNNGSTPSPVSCAALLKMKVTFLSAAGSTGTYDAELLQLDLTGGTLPVGMMLRESPTLASTGLFKSTNLGSGLYRVSSFFDVFTELSTDAGASWEPSNDAPARVELQYDSTASIPAMGTWGMIAFGILLLGIVKVYLKNV